jgi:hypothetical protein
MPGLRPDHSATGDLIEAFGVFPVCFSMPGT